VHLALDILISKFYVYAFSIQLTVTDT